MQRSILCLMAIVAASVMTSCEEVDGNQTPIKLDKSELIFFISWRRANGYCR